MTSPEDEAALLEGLAPDERDAILRIMQQADLQGPEKILGPVLGMEFERAVVPVRQWLEDDYHMGEMGKSLYPKLKDDLVELFEGTTHEAILSGSIGLDSLVQESDGSLPALRERLGKATPVVVLKDRGLEVSDTEPAHRSGVKEVLRVALANGMRLDLTPDHEVQVYRCGVRWVAAENLQVGDLVLVARRIRTTPTSNLSVETARLLAYWVADGSVSETRARFCDGNPKTSLEVLALMRALGFDGVRYPKGKNCWEVHALRTKKSGFLAWLRGYGADAKTADVVVPDAVCRASDDVVAAFLNRLWACEGTVYAPEDLCSPPRFALGMISARFVQQVQLLLLRFGVQARIREVFYTDKRNGASRKVWHLTVSGILELRRFLDCVGIVLGKEPACQRIADYCDTRHANTNVDTLPLTGQQISLRMTEQGIVRPAQNRWWNLATMQSPRVSRALFGEWLKDYGNTPLGETLRGEFPDDVGYEPVVSVEPLPLAIPVGDIGAHNGHRFIANGVSVHNSIGWGKSHFAKLATVRSIYELSCLREPQRSMGLSPDSLISLVAISVKVDIAKRSLLESMAQMMALSPYFVREFQPKVTKESIRFPKGIDLAPAAATNNNVLGLNVFGGILDESAFLGGMTEQQKKDMRRFGFVDRSEILYTLLLRRMKSRYLQRGGKLPGKLFLVSSKRTTNDFIERRIRDARRDGDTFIREYTRWDVKADAFGTKRFWVLVGNEQHHSRILSDKDDPEQYRHLEGAQLHQVPEDLRTSFEKDLDSAIRDDLGVSTVAISPFIGRREKIEDALEQGRVHPFSALEWEAGSVATFRWQYLVHRNPESGENEPLCCPRAPRHAHIDGSLTGDATGLAMAHVHGFKDMERADRSTGSTFIERAPVVKVDFCLRVVPPPGDEIILSDVRVLIYDLAKHGMRVLYVSMDAWQSAEALQQLRQNGYRAEVVSVDRTTVPYELLKAALYEDRLLLYPYPPLQDELRRLEHDRRRGKIDHPSAGSKDISDAVAACVYTLSSSDAAVRANLPTEAFGPSLGFSVDPNSPAATGDFVEGPDGQMLPVEDWDGDFRADGGGFGLPATGSSNGAIVAPPWLSAGKGRVVTLPVQKGARQVP